MLRKKKIYVKSCNTIGSKIFIAITSFLVYIVLSNSLKNIRPSGLQVFDFMLMPVVFGLGVYVFLIFKLNTIDRFLLSDHLNSAQQGDKLEPMSPDLLLRRQPAKIGQHGSSYL